MSDEKCANSCKMYSRLRSNGFRPAQHDDMTEVDVPNGKKLTFFRCVFDSSMLRSVYQQHLMRKAGNAILEEAGFSPDNIDTVVDTMKYVPVPGALKEPNFGGDAFPEPKNEHERMVDFFTTDCREKKK
jgi:hypothetical protein